MKKYFLVILTTLILSCSDDENVVTLPTLSTLEISQLTKISAYSGGVITSDGGGTVFNRGLCYSTLSNPTIEDMVVPNASGTGRFTTHITGLSENTTYFVRAYAINSAGAAYGNEISFKTIASVAPVLTTAAASLITQNTFTSGGAISNDGGFPITTWGICYSTSPTPTVEDQVVDGVGQINFTAGASGLIAGTTYFVRAFATNSVGIGYGNEVTFNTLAATLPVLSTSDISLITASSASSGGEITSDGGGIITERGICWSTTTNPTINDTKVSQGTGTDAFEIRLTALERTTTYFVRAYAVNSAGTAYGPEKSFTTFALAIGDLYQGGTVFYIDATGDHGLVVAENDIEPAMPWGCPGVDVSTSAAVGSGSQNTTNILASCASDGIAAKACHDLVKNGYDDWFLPSKDEWKLIYNNLIDKDLGNFVRNSGYWTSTQFNDEYSIYIDVQHNDFSNIFKEGSTSMVRAVRAF